MKISAAEIVIPAGVTFLHCSKQLDAFTEWRDVASKERMLRGGESERKDKAA
jgi:hypothetical protein